MNSTKSLSVLYTLPSIMLAFLPSHNASSEQQTHALQEITVTAQKREQSLQDTPIAISVLNDLQLDAQGITGLGALGLGAVPSLRIKPLGNTPSNLVMVLRGNGPFDASEVTREGSVAIYLDDVYLGRSQGLGMELADLERIEVLRGPQGTLFGRNAIGGAVSLISKKPTGDWGFKQTLGVGRYNEFRSVTRINLPEFSNLSAKLDYIQSERDGWVNNTAPGESDYSAYDKSGGRLSLHWQPSEALSVDYIYDQSDVETTQNYFQFYKDNIGLFGAELDRKTTTRLPVTSLKPTITDHRGHALTVNWQLSESLKLRSISSHRDLDEDAHNNYAGVLYFNGLIDASIMSQQISTQEFQLLGTHDRLEWVTGLYYLQEEVSKTLQDSFSLDIFGLITGTPLSPIIPTTTFDALSTGANLPARIINADSESRAAYAQATWTPNVLGDKLQLTLGGRYTEDEKQATRLENGIDQSDQDSEHFDVSITANYQWNDSMSSYAKWATAYKAGGVNSRSASFMPFDEELAKTVEFGFKSEFWDNKARLNMALFWTNYEDLQLDFTDPVIVTLTETINAANKVEVDGAEIDLVIAPINRLKLGLSYTYLSTDMPLQPNPLAGGALKEFFVPLAPNHAGALTLDYQFAPWRYGTLAAHFDITSTDHYAQTPFGEQRTDSYTLFNGRLSLLNIDMGNNMGNLAMSIWGKNITDEEYIISAFPVGEPAVSIGQAFGDPRTFGMDLTVSF